MSDNMVNFSERCRLCIEPKRLSIDIFSEQGRRIKLKSKINKNLPLKVSQSDGLPSQICYQCLFRLETWVSFKQLCIERDQVMKTWSQSFLDENSCEREENYNGLQKNCKIVKTKDSHASRNARSRPNSRGIIISNDDFATVNQIDDAKSDTSLWEVVKTDDADNIECGSEGRHVSGNLVVKINSVDFTSEEKQDWNRRKLQKASKVSSSGSDESMTIDVGASCSEILAQPSNDSSLPILTLHQLSMNGQESSSGDVSPLPLKRKRGRPSKAFLQRERELKRLKDQDRVVTENSTSPTCENHCELSVKPDDEKDDDKEDLIQELEAVQNVPLNVVTSDFTPVERDSGCGVTEVVLDDPDFGSMKFTLSLVEVESPTSSPIPNDSFNYSYNYASSSGNVSTESLHREDFEGFESPSSFMKHDDLLSSSDEMTRSKSQTDVSLISSEEALPAVIKRKRINSASGDLHTCLISDDVSVGDVEPPVNHSVDFHSCFMKDQYISKSFENICSEGSSSKHLSDACEERNAYSDGEVSESPNKRLRKKSLVALQ